MSTSANDSPRRDVIATTLTVLAGVLVGLLRLVPHPANFSSLGALGIFSGARLRSWNAFVLPLAVMVSIPELSSAVLPWNDVPMS